MCQMSEYVILVSSKGSLNLTRFLRTTVLWMLIFCLLVKGQWGGF